MASKRWRIITGATIAGTWALWWCLAPEPLETIARHWAVAVTMAFGSLVAGATCEGGGAVAFPVFTKVLHVAPADARWFALAIQSVGMTAAAGTILAMRRTIDTGAIVRAGLGGAVGILIGATVVAPHVQPVVVRVLFTALQCGFAAVLWLSSFGTAHVSGAEAAPRSRASTAILVLAGLLGGVISSLFGNGLDLIVFSVLVLLFRVDERVATPTTVVLMASNSLVGFACGAAGQQITATVWEFWVAAIPIVVVGAPLGAVLSRRLSRNAIVGMLVSLIAVELASTLWLIPMTTLLLAVAGVSLALFIGAYAAMVKCRRFWPAAGEQIEYGDAAP